MRDYFSGFGQVNDCKLMIDNVTRKSRFVYDVFILINSSVDANYFKKICYLSKSTTWCFLKILIYALI